MSHFFQEVSELQFSDVALLIGVGRFRILGAKV